jgi:hypothetical protein
MSPTGFEPANYQRRILALDSQVNGTGKVFCQFIKVFRVVVV